MNPEEAVMRRRSAENRIRSAQVSVDFLETPKEAWYRAGADGDMGADFHIPSSQPTGDDLYTLFRFRVLHQ